MSRDNRQSYFDPYWDEYYDEIYNEMAPYDAHGNFRNLQAEMEASWRRLCDRLGFKYEVTRC